jgi:MFS family permease
MGLSVAAISTFMAAVIMGGVVFQLPVGRLSDRLDRRWVIAISALLTGLVVLPPAILPQLPNYTLYPGFFLVGGLSLPLYAVCVAHTNDFLTPEQAVNWAVDGYRALLRERDTGWLVGQVRAFGAAAEPSGPMAAMPSPRPERVHACA